MANYYQGEIDKINKAIELLIKQNKVSTDQKSTWEQINKISDVLDRYRKLLNFYNSQKNWPEIEDVLKDYLATEEGQVWKLPIEKQKELLTKYNQALYYLKQKGEIDKSQQQELIEINQNKKYTLTDRLVAIIRFYKKYRFPNIDEVYKEYKQSMQDKQKETMDDKDKLNFLANRGIDSAKLSEKQIELLLSYIRFLEKITSKHVVFK